MGGVSIGMQSSYFLNIANPASLTGIESQRYIIDVGLMGAIEQYKRNSKESTSMVGNLNNVGFGFRILPRYYGAVSLTPVSSVGYTISVDNEVDGSQANITSLFKGEGGLSKIGFSNAFLIGKGLSVGASFSYVSGKVTESETQATMLIRDVSEKKAFYADFGLQYKHNFSADRYAILGAVYGYSQQLRQDNKRTVVSSTTSINVDEKGRTVKQSLPQFMGVGFSYGVRRWLLAAEYKYVDWSAMGVSQSSAAKYSNQHIGRVGANYLAGNLYKMPIQLMFGAGYSNSYLVIRGEKPKNFYLSAGVGMPIQSSVVSVGFKYGDQLNSTKSSLSERSFSFYANITFGERMFKLKLK